MHIIDATKWMNLNFKENNIYLAIQYFLNFVVTCNAVINIRDLNINTGRCSIRCQHYSIFNNPINPDKTN